MTKNEASLLLYLETCVVDRGGHVDARRMTNADITMAKLWDKTGYIEFGRLLWGSASEGTTHVVRLSDLAWKDAHKERKLRGEKAGEFPYDKVCGNRKARS